MDYPFLQFPKGDGIVSSKESGMETIRKGLEKITLLHPISVLKCFHVFNDEGDPDILGDEVYWWTWEPETLHEEIGPSAKKHMEVIMGVASAISQAHGDNPQFVHWNEPDVFGAFSEVCIWSKASYGYYPKPSWHAAHAALECLKAIHRDADLEEDVWLYLAASVLDKGLVTIPWAPPALEQKLRFLTPDAIDALAGRVREIWDDEEKRKHMIENPSATQEGIQILRLEVARAMAVNREHIEAQCTRVLKGGHA